MEQTLHHGEEGSKPADNIRTSTIHYHFRTPAFEFVFQWILGAGTNGGSEVGECFYAASQVKENDPDSWVRAFSSMAQSVKNKADGSFRDGHMAQLVFDWLDDIVQEREQSTAPFLKGAW